MRIAICDDEKNIRELIESKVRKQYPEAEIVFFSSGEELLLSDMHIDILFLDIQMSGRNGIETAKELRKNNRRMIIIFVTAVEEYVFQAFDVGAFHYIVKPIDDEKFSSVLQRAVEEWCYKNKDVKAPEENYILINNSGVHTKVVLDEIIYAEVFNRKVVIHKLNETIEYYGKLSDLESVAGDSFFRPHRAYLINFKYVEKYDANDTNHITVVKGFYTYKESKSIWTCSFYVWEMGLVEPRTKKLFMILCNLIIRKRLENRG